MMTAITQRNLPYIFASLLLSFSIPASVVAAPLNWQGPYAGIYLGGSFGNDHFSTSTGTPTPTSYFTTSADANAVSNASSQTNNPSSGIIGIQAGHDWVWKQLVYGVVFDYGALPLNTSKSVSNVTYPDNPGTYSVYTSMSTNWLFTLRGRLGYQTNIYWPSLVYLTGGMAITTLKVNNSFSDTSPLAGIGGNSTARNEIGWTAGAGIELASFKHASVNFEYLYMQVPSVNTTGSISNSAGGFGIPVQSMTSPFTTSGNFHASVFKIGLNYRFDESANR